MSQSRSWAGFFKGTAVTGALAAIGTGAYLTYKYANESCTGLAEKPMHLIHSFLENTMGINGKGAMDIKLGGLPLHPALEKLSLNFTTQINETSLQELEQMLDTSLRYMCQAEIIKSGVENIETFILLAVAAATFYTVYTTKQQVKAINEQLGAQAAELAQVQVVPANPINDSIRSPLLPR